MSLGGGITKKEETNIVNNKISECKEGSDKATMFQNLACVVMDPSSPHLLSYALFQPVLSGATASNVKSF